MTTLRRAVLVLCFALLPLQAFATVLSSDIGVTATDSPDPVAPDGDITYAVTVTNAGPDPTTNAHLNVILGGTLLFQSITVPAGWTCPALAIGYGASFTCTAATLGASTTSNFTVVLHAGQAQFGIIDQTITENFNVNSANSDPANANNSINVSTSYVAPKADMSITATDSPDPVAPDGNITYTVTATNNGPDTASTAHMSVVLNGTLLLQSLTTPAGWSCPSLPVGYGGSFSCTATTMAASTSSVFTVVLNAGSLQFGNTDKTLNELFGVNSATFDTNHANDNITVSTAYHAPKADIAIAVTDAPDPVAPDGNITYTVTVTNNGPDAGTTAHMNVVLNGTLLFQSVSTPAGWSCAAPPVNSGASFTCTAATLAASSTSVFTVVLKAGLAQFGNTNQTIHEIFGANSAAFDTNNANDIIDVSTAYVVPVANLAITNSDTPDPVNSGATITYTQVLTSAGPDPATNTVVTEAIGSGVTFQSLNPPAGFNCTTPSVGGAGLITCTNPSFGNGASATFTVVVNVTAVSGVVTNIVSASSNASDPVSTNNSATATTAVNAPLSADLSITKTTLATGVLHGGTLSYTLVVTNNGPGAASTVTVTDALPAALLFQSIAAPGGFSCATPAVGATGTIACTAATLANGATATFTLVTTVAANATGSIVNAASVGSATSDPISANSAASAASVPVSPSAPVGGAVPTLGEWALLALALTLAAGAMLRLRG